MKRLQFDFPDEKVKELDDLVERTGFKTRVQLFNSALSLFEWAIREREAGRIVASVDESTDRYKEVVMPGFPDLKIPDELKVVMGNDPGQETFETKMGADLAQRYYPLREIDLESTAKALRELAEIIKASNEIVGSEDISRKSSLDTPPPLLKKFKKKEA